MHAPTFEQVLAQILARDPRYHREAYLFVREALDHTQKLLAKKTGKVELRHVTGQELLEGIRQYALQQYGPLTLMVLEEWGVRRCEDFGELVFNMVETHLLAKTDTDTREDFRGGYDFHEAFRKPFLSRRAQADALPEMKPTQA
jgi:uncharacterized repeat protein (TIGR04138 family)